LAKLEARGKQLELPTPKSIEISMADRPSARTDPEVKRSKDKVMGLSGAI